MARQCTDSSAGQQQQFLSRAHCFPFPTPQSLLVQTCFGFWAICNHPWSSPTRPDSSTSLSGTVQWQRRCNCAKDGISKHTGSCHKGPGHSRASSLGSSSGMAASVAFPPLASVCGCGNPVTMLLGSCLTPLVSAPGLQRQQLTAAASAAIAPGRQQQPCACLLPSHKLCTTLCVDPQEPQQQLAVAQQRWRLCTASRCGVCFSVPRAAAIERQQAPTWHCHSCSNREPCLVNTPGSCGMSSTPARGILCKQQAVNPTCQLFDTAWRCHAKPSTCSSRVTQDKQHTHPHIHTLAVSLSCACMCWLPLQPACHQTQAAQQPPAYKPPWHHRTVAANANSSSRGACLSRLCLSVCLCFCLCVVCVSLLQVLSHTPQAYGPLSHSSVTSCHSE